MYWSVRRATRAPTATLLGSLLLLALLMSLACSPLVAADAANAEAITCSYCQKRGFPYVCRAPLQSGLCFTNSGDVRCDGEKGCTCCRTADANGCTFCSMEADWDAYDDGEDDI